MRRLFHILILLSIAMIAKATDYRTERIFIAPTGSEYRPGDSITVVGQIIATDSVKTPFSKYLYIEIFDRKDSVLLRKKLRSNEQGQFMARLQASPVWESDIYYLRAYTGLMQNFSPKTFPVVPLQIGKKVEQPECNATSVHCRFYPEGGTLVEGKTQRVVFQLTDYRGFPLSIPYSIIAGQDTLANGQTTPSGFQQMQYIPQHGKRVELHANLEGGIHTFALPIATEGATLQMAGNTRRMSYQVLLSGLSADSLNLYCFHQDIGLKALDIRTQQSGIIDLKGIGAGVLTLFLTDSNPNILAERSCYVHKEEEQPIQPLEKTLYRPGEVFSMPASQEKTLVRFYPEDYWCSAHAETALNGTSDLTSELRFPIHYYSADEKTRRLELDCWLATTRFERFDLKKVMQEGFHYQYPYENALTIEGYVTDQYKKRIKEGVLNAFNTESGSAHQGELDEEGNFSIPVTDFAEGDVFFLSCMAGKKQKGGQYKYHFKDEVYPGVVNLLPVGKEKALGNVEVEIGTDSQSDYGIDKDNLLPEVRVKARTKADNHVPTKEFYNTHFVDVEAKDKYHDFASIIADIPVISLDVTKEIDPKTKQIKVTYNIFPNRGQSLFGENGNNKEEAGAVILVDCMRITANEAVQFLPFELSTVEYLPPKDAMKITSGAIYGALVIKTRGVKKGKKNIPAQGIQYMPMGLANMDILHTEWERQSCKVPIQEGKYRVLVDRISDKGEVHSYEYRIEVSSDGNR